ncbi:MAG: preprotein translocase subunit YajC [Phycisphaerae bacterium]|nr:preprotein translocase subunit YajC [Phycisphaerae bacterium]
MIDIFALLAEADSTTPPTTQGTGSGGGSMFNNPIIPLILMIGVFWFIMSRGKSKERRKYEAMLNALKRNDRVQTVGGVIGTVVDVRDNEVVLKVDETSNTKMRFNRSSIKEVLQDLPGGEG